MRGKIIKKKRLLAEASRKWSNFKLDEQKLFITANSSKWQELDKDSDFSHI